MFSPELGRHGFRIAMSMTLASTGLLFFQAPGSAERVLMVATLAIGVVFLLLIIVLVRWSNRYARSLPSRCVVISDGERSSGYGCRESYQSACC
jgi:pilus assembly protein TadC